MFPCMYVMETYGALNAYNILDIVKVNVDIEHRQSRCVRVLLYRLPDLFSETLSNPL